MIDTGMIKERNQTENKHTSTLFALSDAHTRLVDILEKSAHFTYSKQLFVHFLSEEGKSFCLQRLGWETPNVAILYFYFFATSASMRQRVVREMRMKFRSLGVLPCTKPLRSLLVRYELTHETLTAVHFPQLQSTTPVPTNSTSFSTSRSRSTSRTLPFQKFDLEHSLPRYSLSLSLSPSLQLLTFFLNF
jgi:hypothetical protein